MGWVAHEILVSAQCPLVFGFLGLGLRGLGPGLDNYLKVSYHPSPLCTFQDGHSDEEIAAYRDTFTKFDVDGGGAIDAAELGKLIRVLG